ncbi:hypothetical protein BG015_007124 [Linnemannia schmuckeri]|uniref:Uncharacterized protein n=1 Tax=Linnemannia schmuckeri TaxID=64567 RepID=A0A9P5S1N1_9FUNG|nr:hypothetical protein BG015_007124 [Linnemannia schmuckeri]
MYLLLSTTNLEDDDDEDLYDSESGIGGNGRRRFRNRDCSAVGGCGNALLPTALSVRSSMIDSSSAARSPSRSIDATRGKGYQTAAATMVPSPAVISTAATAVTTEWKKPDALATATADPSGIFLAEYSITPQACQSPESSCNSSRGSPAVATGKQRSPNRKNIGDFRRNNSLSSGLSHLAGGRRSLGLMFSDNSGNNNNRKNVSATTAAAAAARHSQQQQRQQQQPQPSSLSSVARRTEVPVAPPAAVPTTASGSDPAFNKAAGLATVLAVPPFAGDNGARVTQLAEAGPTTGPD